jgi:hypothetical protein
VLLLLAPCCALLWVAFIGVPSLLLFTSSLPSLPSPSLLSRLSAIVSVGLQVMSPTASVKEAMSNVTATQRQRKAAWEQGEADKVRAGLASVWGVMGKGGVA